MDRKCFSRKFLLLDHNAQVFQFPEKKKSTSGEKKIDAVWEKS